jgi:hypothetical protein
MAAVTPTSVNKLSLGNVQGLIANFANTTDNGDTWASGINGILAVLASQADGSGTQASEGAGASFSGTTVTIQLAEDNSAVTLLVLSAGG